MLFKLKKHSNNRLYHYNKDMKDICHVGVKREHEHSSGIMP